MQVQFDRGVYLPELDLWLDPQAPRALGFVSHAHADHVGWHDHVIATPATAAMMRQRSRAGGCRAGGRVSFRALEYRQPLRLGDATVTLYPAGHILGSAQILVESGRRRLLYSGDFKLRGSRSTETAEVPEADTLIMETTFGRPRYRFPATEETAAAIRAFCIEALEAGETPVLLCYSLGKGQELLAWLDGLEEHLWLHPHHAEMAALYRSLGVTLPRCQTMTPGAAFGGGILLCASGCRRAQWFARIRRPRTAYVSGWAIDAGASFRFGTDAAFPLSDHADYDDLHEYVRRTGARTIYTLHGFAREFARDLRNRGYHARSVEEREMQLSLAL